MDLIKNLKDAQQAIYKHVGFIEDWVIYPFDFRTEYVWRCEGGIVRYAKTEDDFFSDGDYYEDELYTQRFYSKHVYAGKIYTMIFCDTHTDGMKYFALFDNKKMMPSFEKHPLP